MVYRCSLPQSGYWQSHQVGFIFIITSRWSREWEGREYLEERTTVNVWLMYLQVANVCDNLKLIMLSNQSSDEFSSKMVQQTEGKVYIHLCLSEQVIGNPLLRIIILWILMWCHRLSRSIVTQKGLTLLSYSDKN